MATLPARRLACSIDLRAFRPERGTRVAELPTSDDPTTRDLLVLRDTLARELDTINEYERAIEKAGTPAVKALLAHLRDEEKEHVAECMQYIRRLDAAQNRFFEIDVEQLVGTPQNRAEITAESARLPAPGVPRQGLTVGSLKGPRGR